VKPPPGVDLVDKIALAFDQRERAQAQQPAEVERMMAVMVKMVEMQSQTLQALTALVSRMEDQKAPAPKDKQP
jgi:hypothetical protein